jgi:hypothetical protein
MSLPGIYNPKVPTDPKERELFEVRMRKKKTEDTFIANKCKYIFKLSLMLAPVSGDGRMLPHDGGVPDFKTVDARDEGRLCAHNHFRSIMLGWNSLSTIEIMDIQRLHEYEEEHCPIQTKLMGTKERMVFRREQALKYAKEKVKPWFASAQDKATMSRWMQLLAKCKVVDGLIDCPFPKPEQRDMELRFYKEHIGYAMDALELLLLLD